MEIKVIGAGCELCAKLYEQTQEALKQEGISASVEKVENLAEIVKLGVTSAPALMVDGQIVVSGQAPAAHELANRLRAAAKGSDWQDIADKEIAKVFKAFCDENRVRILKLLRSGEKCACVLLEDLRVSQPTLSHHMKILTDAGIVNGRKEGKWVHYSLSRQGVARAMAFLEQTTTLIGEEEAGCDCMQAM